MHNQVGGIVQCFGIDCWPVRRGLLWYRPLRRDRRQALGEGPDSVLERQHDVAGTQLTTVGEQRGTVQHVTQLANVARP
ncbi:hypothetical protein D3C71_1935500 [compost metagenome]